MGSNPSEVDMHRFFIVKENLNLDEKIARITDKDDVKHAVKALRIELGEQIELCDTDGMEHICEVKVIGTDEVVCSVLTSEMNKRESAVEITLFQGLPKADKLELIIQKTTELGVMRIVPLQMKRSVVKWKEDKSAAKKVERWNRIAFEASKQSKRGRIPRVDAPLSMRQFLSEMDDFDLVIMPYENEAAVGIGPVLSACANAKKVAIVIGPEGGIDEEEVLALTEGGAKSVKMGPRILRTETAGLTAVALVQYAIGDLSGV